MVHSRVPVREALAYWTRQLAGATAGELPLAWSPRAGAARPGRVSCGIEPALAAGLQVLGARLEMPPAVVHLAALRALLARLDATREPCIGWAPDDQDERGLAVLPLRAAVRLADSFGAILERERELVRAAERHRDVPFALVAEALALPRGAARWPFVQLTCAGAVHELAPGRDLALDLREPAFVHGGEGDGDAVTAFAARYTRLLRAVVARPEAPLRELELLAAEERERLLVGPARRVAWAPRGPAAIEQIEACMRGTPGAPAIVTDDGTTSYGELDLASAELAARLRERGVGPERGVAVIAERGVAQIVSLLAVWRAGGVYVPITPDLPGERIAWMVDDTRPAVILATRALPRALAHHARLAIRIDERGRASDEPAPAPRRPPDRAAPPEALAYVIYTSGSTGRPKGVMVPRRGFAAQLRWMQAEYRLAARDRVLQLSSPMFDFALLEIAWPLAAGGAVVVPRPDGELDPPYLAELARRAGATAVSFVPALLRVVLDTSRQHPWPTIETVLCGGEALTADLVRDLPSVFPRARLHNQYGPTETTINATAWPCDVGAEAVPEPVPIGLPVADTTAYVLDEDLAPVPPGGRGELWIGGVQLARGYLHRPALTAERFLPDPFAARPGHRMYRTGDRVRQRVDGTLEYLGRVDEQVKVRGLRIELGEIEAVLREHPRVRLAAAAVGGERLVAYVCPSGPTSVEELRAHVAARVPPYMLPTAFVLRAELPRLPSGKLDRGALAASARAGADGAQLRAGEGPVAPRTPMEQALHAIWLEVLGPTSASARSLGVHDSFFAVGGTSLSAIRVVSRARERLGVELPASALHAAPTIAALAREVARHPHAGQLGEAAEPASSERPLSPAERGIWLHDREHPGRYALLGTVALAGPLDRDRLRRALHAVARRHAPLRSVFIERDGEPWARALPAPDDLLAIDDAEGSGPLAARVAAERRHVFDAARGPVARFALVPIARERHVLVVNVHHLAWDALSQRAFVAELARSYAEDGARSRPDPSPAPIGPSVAALVARERALLADAARRGALITYWRATLADPPPPPELAERPPAPADTHAAGSHAFALPADLAARVRALCGDTGATLFTGLVAVLQLLVARYADSDDVIVGTAVSTRPDERADALIGCLVQPLPLRLSLRGDPTLRELVQRAHAMVAGALAHSGLPLAELAGVARSPLFDVTFNLYAATPRAAAGELALAWEDLDSERTPYALSMSVVDADPGTGASTAQDLRGTIQFDLDRFDPDWIAAFARRYRALLEAAVDSPDARVSHVARAVTQGLVTARAAAALGIRAAAVRRAARLAPPQREIYLGYERSDELRRYLVHALPLGPVDPQRWARALALVTEREELARSRIAARAGRLFQVVTEAMTGGPPPLVLERAAAASIAAFVQRTAKIAYDLERDPLVRHWLVRDAAGCEWAVIAWSHILFDARSAALLFARATHAYGQLARGDALQLPAHGSFLEAADELTATFDGADTLAFWREELSRAAPLEPHDRPGAAATTRSRSAIVDGALRERARALCRDLGTTEPALYRALFAIALDAVYGGADDFVLYEIRDGRRADQRDVIGAFHTVLPRVVSRAAIGHSVDALLEQQRQVGSRTRAHPHLSVHARRRLFDDPFQAYYNFYDFVDVAGPAGPATLETYDSFAERELHLVVEASARRLALGLHYDARVLADDRLLERLLLLLERACAGERDVARGELLLADELATVEAPNAAARELPYVESVVDAFERQVALRPDAIALRADGATLTYRELNERSHRLAHRLRARGLGREARVAICLERGLDLPIAILGILEAGCAYVPIDPDVPPERVRHILADSAAALAVTSPALEPALPRDVERIIVDEPDPPDQPGAPPPPPPDDPPRAIAAGDLAYVIYTSGSTGLPKGVLVSHGNLIRLFRATEPWFEFGPDDVWTLFHSCAFDFSVWELFGALVYGGQLVIVSRACARSVEDFYRLVAEARVTVLSQTPSAFRQLALVDPRARAPLPALRLVVFGGEALDYHALAPWLATHGVRPRLVNMYGITETTVHVTYRQVAPEEARAGQPSCIGVPIPDLQIYLLDRLGRRVPPGLAGELHVAGAGVARGYHARPALTRERFVTSRFGRLYRSGDLARVGRGGELEYLGRADQQVKIRGYRVELGEIEAALRAHPDVRDAVVLAERDAMSGARLLAYAVVAALPGPPASALAAHLAARLPEYMVPATYANLAQLPLTANGKLDRAALPRTGGALATSHAEPRDDVERALCEIWRAILKLPRIGIHDDFFALGGHSMLALRLIDRVRATFRAHVPLRALFTRPTVAGLAEVIAAQLAAEPVAGPAPPAAAPAALAAAPAGEIVPSVWQALVWRSQQRDPHNAFLTVDSGMLIEGPLDVAALSRAVDLVIARQPALRLRFHERAGELRARVVDAPAGALQIARLADVQSRLGLTPPADPRAAAIEACTRLVCEPFDLVAGPVFRAALVQLGPTSYVLGFAASHIIADGSSLGVWYADLAAYYNALVTAETPQRAPLAPLAIDLADHQRSQQELAAGPEGARQRAYWRAALRDIEIVRLPGESTAAARPALAFHEGATLRSSIDAELTRRIRALAEHERVPVYVVLCTAVMATLHAGSGQDRFCVASSSSQRQWPGVEQLIGFFTNPLFVIADFRGVATWRELVQHIADAAFHAFEHPDVPIATEVSPGLTRFNLNYINATRLRPRPLHALSVEPVALADAGRRLCAYNDLILWLVEDEARIELELFYRVDLFDPAIARRFIVQVRDALDAMTAAPDRAFSRAAAGTPGS